MKTKSAWGEYFPLTFRKALGRVGLTFRTYRLRYSVEYIVTTNQVNLIGTMLELVSKKNEEPVFRRGDKQLDCVSASSARSDRLEVHTRSDWL